MALQDVAHVLLEGPPLSGKVATHSLKYQQLVNDVDLVAHKEEMRRMRISTEILKARIDDMDNEIWQQKEQAQQADLESESTRSELQSHLEETEEQLQTITTQFKVKERELTTLKTELSSLQNISADSTKLLTEKLALARELDNLKPELDDLRSQVESRKGLLSEKLSLQRRVSLMQAELDNEKRTAERLREREGLRAQEETTYETELARLRDELAKAQRESDRGEKATSKNKDEEIKRLKAELTEEKKQRAQMEKSVGGTDSDQLNELQRDLAKERRERERLEKQIVKVQTELEAERAVLEDKLSQFRTKLKATKEKLKDTELELHEVRSATSSKQSSTTVPKPKNPKKRTAVALDPDAAIGTPGDARAAKRTQRASSVIGEKSTFSITPFLNRTTSVAPEDQTTNQEDHNEIDADKPMASIEADSPIAQRRPNSTISASVAEPLGPAPSSKANAKIIPTTKARQKAASKISLEKVVEEPDDIEEGVSRVAETEVTIHQGKQASVQQTRRLKSTSLKPKSLSSFASFRAGSLPPQAIQPAQKKTRKLGGGVKTLLDDDDDNDEEDAGATARLSAAAKAGGQRTFGAFGSRTFGGLGAWAANRKKGPLMVAEDGFMFSPLKKDRKAVAMSDI